MKILECADPQRQESLQAEVIPDPMEGEQTWPTEEELAEAEGKLIIFNVSLQAPLILPVIVILYHFKIFIVFSISQKIFILDTVLLFCSAEPVFSQGKLKLFHWICSLEGVYSTLELDSQFPVNLYKHY